MPTRRAIKGVLAGFLGTYASRYSDFHGYWLDGQLSFDTPQYEFNLLASTPIDDTPVNFAWRLANRRFAEQVAKAGLTVDLVSEAALLIMLQPEIVNGWHGSQRSDGHIVRFEASTLMDNGTRFVRQQTLFVAPHDPKKESRRAPEHWGS